MKAPVVPLYSLTMLLLKLATNRLPLGPNASPRAFDGPPTRRHERPSKAPVTPLNFWTELVRSLT